MEYKCGYCQYEGQCYGTPYIGGEGAGVSAPWCARCGINNMLTPVEEPTDA